MGARERMAAPPRNQTIACRFNTHRSPAEAPLGFGLRLFRLWRRRHLSAGLRSTRLRSAGLLTRALRPRLLARQATLPRLVDADHLDHHLVALFEDVGDGLDPLVGQLGDVNQAVGP